MRLSLWAAAPLGLLATSSAIASPRSNNGGAVTIPLQRSKMPHAQTVARKRALNGYEPRAYGDAAWSSEPSWEKRQTAGHTDIPVNDMLFDWIYSCNVSFGTPPQTFTVALDTGSPTLWIAAEGCGGDGSCSGMPLFNPAKSATFANLSTPMYMPYGMGAANGTLAKDVVSMGGWSIPHQEIMVVDYLVEMSANAAAGVSGLMGLGPASYLNDTNFLVNVSRGWTQKEMGFYAGRAPIIPGATQADQVASVVPNSEITFGGVDTTKFQGPINYIPTNSSKVWAIPFESVMVGSNTFLLEEVAVIDTGTAMIYGPSTDVAALYASIPNSQPLPSNPGFYYMPCADIPPISFVFNGITYPLYLGDLFTAYQSNDGSIFCVGNIIGDTTTDTVFNGSPIWILGDAFLKNVYTSFRLSPLSVGFAQLTPEANIVTTVASGAATNFKSQPVTTGVAASLATVAPVPPVPTNTVAAGGSSGGGGGGGGPKVGSTTTAAATGTAQAVSSKQASWGSRHTSSDVLGVTIGVAAVVLLVAHGLGTS